MKKLLTLMMWAVFAATTNAEAQYDWAKSLGMSGSVIDITNDASDNLYASGTFTGTTTVSLGPDAISCPAEFVTKISPSGTILWGKKASTTRVEIHDMAIGNGIIVVVGRTLYLPQAGFIALFDASGNKLSEKINDVGGDYKKVVINGSDIYVCGSSQTHALRILKFNTSLNVQWTANVSTSSTLPTDIGVANGKIIVVGDYGNSVSLGDAHGSTPIPLTGGANRNLFEVALDADGYILSATSAPGSSTNPAAFSTTITPDGTMHAAWDGSNTIHYRKLSLGFSSDNTTTPISQSCPLSSGSYAKGSTFNSTDVVVTWGGFICQLFGYRISSSGSALDTFEIQGTLTGLSLSFDNDGAVYVANNFKDPISYKDGAGTKVLTPVGSDDIYIAKYHQCQSSTVTVTKTGTDLTASAPAGVTFQWYLNGNPLNGETKKTITPKTSGTYTVKVTDPHDCSSISTGVEVTVGINDVSQITPVIYPNPATSIVTVEGLPNGSQIQLTDITGKMLISTTQHSLHIQHLSSGVYIIKTPYGASMLHKN